ncbi:MAG: L-aspartate oxidase [Ruminiclostridium sp.]|nr:L-aspartate oxidase [Ruminiclostridium sp.]
MDFDSEKLIKEYHDVIIIGSGIAGVFTALEISQEYDVAILTKETLDISNSVLAQGGIAVSLDKKDSPELHFKDTLYAGAGLCDEESVWVLVNEAASNIDRLCNFGVNFDKTKQQELALTREAAHSMNRIIHAGDTTGKEVCDKLISVVKTRNNIKICERTFVIDLVTKDGACKGVLVCDENGDAKKFLVSDIVVCATGGFGQLFSSTTNPEVATGDGISMAYRAGAELMDLEFVQFHPTVLYHPQNKSFLISEAVRGEGALLKNAEGKRFMPEYHPLNELAPRDVVSRAIFEEMKRTRTSNVFLDISFKDKDYLEARFPNIYKTCLGYGIDITKDMIPVAPAEHYCMGGIKADVNGKTNINGFFTCGECACNGIHGANRLASNSLLEGLVFGRLIGEQADRLLKNSRVSREPLNLVYKTNRNDARVDSNLVRTDIQKEMTREVGIIRNREGLLRALNKVNSHGKMLEDSKSKRLEDFELQNILLLSRLVIESALEREESRGAHYRSDFSKTDDENWKRHIIKSGKIPNFVGT